MSRIHLRGRVVLGFLILCGLFATLLGSGPLLAGQTPPVLETTESLTTVLASARAPARSADDYLFPVESGGKYGYIDATGRVVIPLQFAGAGAFHDGQALAQFEAGFGTIGFIDATGTMVIQPQYERAGDFSEGLCPVQIAEKWGFIDTSGETVIPFQYDWARGFSEGRAAVAIMNGERHRYGFIDASGTLVIPCQYDWVDDFSEGLAMVRSDGRCGFVDFNGQVVIPLQYQAAGDFSEGLCQAAAGGKYGFIDRTGTMVISSQYDWVGFQCWFSEGLAEVAVWAPDGSSRNLWGFIDRTGTMVIQPQFDNWGDPSGFSEGLCSVRLKGTCGYIDHSGAMVIQPQYETAAAFHHGLAWVVFDNDNRVWGYIDKSGRLVWHTERWNDASGDFWLATYGLTWQQVAALASGYNDRTFRPGQPVTRGQFAKMCVSGLFLDTVEPATATFLDVPPDSIFYPYVEGAFAAGLILGSSTSAGLVFSPDNDISRQQAASILARYLSGQELAANGVITGASGATYPSLIAWYAAEGQPYVDGFSDAAAILPDHAPGMAYLVYRGVMKGSGDSLDPGAELSRAQAAVLVLRTGATFSFGPGPTVANVAPTWGPKTGGTTVTITGSTTSPSRGTPN